MKDTWLAWRLVLSGKASLQELETHYSIDDLLDGCQALELQEEADRRAQRAAGNDHR